MSLTLRSFTLRNPEFSRVVGFSCMMEISDLGNGTRDCFGNSSHRPTTSLGRDSKERKPQLSSCFFFTDCKVKSLQYYEWEKRSSNFGCGHKLELLCSRKVFCSSVVLEPLCHSLNASVL